MLQNSNDNDYLGRHVSSKASFLLGNMKSFKVLSSEMDLAESRFIRKVVIKKEVFNRKIGPPPIL